MPTTNFKNSSGTDIGDALVEKSYLMDRYPELADTFKQAGLWSWGYNASGQLGDNTYTTRSSPVQTAAGGTNWKMVTAGGYVTSAIKTDGTLWSWGYGYYGQIGNNTSGFTNYPSPVETVSGGTNWKAVSNVYLHTMAIKTDGTLWTWGYNFYGNLGDGTTTYRSSPVQISGGGTNWKELATGTSSANGAAIKTDGTLWIWGKGRDGYGNLGIGPSGVGVDKSTPVQIAGTTWRQISIGYNHTLATKTDNTLWAWGSEDNGQLGLGNTQTPRSTPVQVPGTTWKRVSCGNYHTAAIKTDGTLWCWGQNWYGQLGNGVNSGQYGVNGSPVQTIAGGTNWKLVVGAYYNTIAIKTDGTLWGWGKNDYYNLGDGTTTARSSPVQMFPGSYWMQITGAGAVMVSGIRDDSADIFGNNL